MMSGLSQSLLPLLWDSKAPQNVNDADLVRSFSEPIRPRDRPTEMAFCLLLNELYKFKTEADKSNDSPAFEAAVLG